MLCDGLGPRLRRVDVKITVETKRSELDLFASLSPALAGAVKPLEDILVSGSVNVQATVRTPDGQTDTLILAATIADA